jgi:hypothetical protein
MILSNASTFAWSIWLNQLPDRVFDLCPSGIDSWRKSMAPIARRPAGRAAPCVRASPGGGRRRKVALRRLFGSDGLGDRRDDGGDPRLLGVIRSEAGAAIRTTAAKTIRRYSLISPRDDSDCPCRMEHSCDADVRNGSKADIAVRQRYGRCGIGDGLFEVTGCADLGTVRLTARGLKCPECLPASQRGPLHPLEGGLVANCQEFSVRCRARQSQSS